MKALTWGLLAVAAVLGGLLVWRQAAPGVSGGEALETPRPLPAVALLSDRGAPTTLAAGDGRMRLVFYGFVRCPDVCPATLAALKNTYAALTPGQQGRVQVQMVSVDPAHDRPALLRAYLDKFDPAFTGLTGTDEAVDAAAREMFVSLVRPLPDGGSGAHAGHAAATSGATTTSATTAGTHEDDHVSASSAALIHGDQVSVVDAGNRFVRVYSNGDVIDGTLGRDLPGLIRQYGGS